MAKKGLGAVPRDTQARIARTIDALATDPRPRGVKKLAGGEGRLRIRVGDYRVLYTVDDTARVVIVGRVAHRREAYR